MKIALVAERFDPRFGGLERWTVDFARHLAGCDHEVHVAAFGGEPEPGIRLHRVASAGTELGRARALDRMLATLPGAIVHDTGLGRSGDVFHPQTGSRLASLDREIATHSRVRRLKAAVSPRTQIRRGMLALIERAQLRRAVSIVAVSSRVRDLLIDRGAPADRIRIVHNGTDADRFASDRLAPLRTPERRALGVADDEVLFVGVAHNLRLKGADLAIGALARLRDRRPGIRLVLAGGAPPRDVLHLVDSLRLGAAVTFAGYIPQIERLFAAADVFLHPSRWDACSVATVEAMASGLPVVTSRHDGAADLVRSGETGFVLDDPEDIEALASVMERLAEPGLRAAMTSAAASFAAGTSPRPFAQDYGAIEEVLAEVADRRRFVA